VIVRLCSIATLFFLEISVFPKNRGADTRLANGGRSKTTPSNASIMLPRLELEVGRQLEIDAL
jgi:hypothetical protein